MQQEVPAPTLAQLKPGSLLDKMQVPDKLTVRNSAGALFGRRRPTEH